MLLWVCVHSSRECRIAAQLDLSMYCTVIITKQRGTRADGPSAISGDLGQISAPIFGVEVTYTDTTFIQRA
jgi:hypothetical protein